MSHGQSIVCAWREFELTNKIAEWNVLLRFQTALDVEHGSRMFVLPYGRILFMFSTTKNGLVITLEVLYEGKFAWLYRNMIFMVFRCLPPPPPQSRRESFLRSWSAENNHENGANSPAFHFVLREEQLRREIA